MWNVKNNLHHFNLQYIDVQGDSMYESTWKSTIRHFLPPLEVPVWHIFFKKRLFQVDSFIQFYRLMQLIFFNII